MLNYLAFRTVKGALTFLAAVTLTFLILRLMPGDPTTIFISDSMSPDDVAALNITLGLDKSIPEQYLIFLRNLVQLEFGQSFFYKEPVIDIIAPRLMWTLLLVGTALTLTVAIGVPFGIFSAVHRGKTLDQVITTGTVIGISIFIPLLAFVLIYLFSLQLGLTPVGGAYDPGHEGAWGVNVVRHMVLPVATLVIVSLAQVVLFTRSSMLDVLKEDYIRTARAKGAGERRVLWGHAIRNAMIPTVTIVGLMIGKMVAGAVLTETIFAWPGIGSMIYEGVQKQDYPLLQGAFIVLAFSVIVMTLITDLVVAWLDPRVKL
jgi:ABC-type dipeptide/oligopeptide/nickel transport system permease component